jgi:hypothetical protein
MSQTIAKLTIVKLKVVIKKVKKFIKAKKITPGVYSSSLDFVFTEASSLITS